MGVLTEITECVLSTTEGSFRVHDPFGAEQRASPCCEGLRIAKGGECSVEGEFVLCIELFQAIHEFTPEDFFEHLNREEELLLRVDPPRVVWSQAAGGNHTMNVGMMLEFLIPGVQDAEEPDLRAEGLRIAGDLQQRFGAAPE